MKKVYVKPSVVLDEEELVLSCILCAASFLPERTTHLPAPVPMLDGTTKNRRAGGNMAAGDE